ncbi:MAG: DegQ family serine endoprotease [Candidatus Methylomirabilales bacterium]
MSETQCARSLRARRWPLRWASATLLAIAVALAAAESGAAEPLWTEKAPDGKAKSFNPLVWVDLAKQAKPAVVNISTTQVIKGGGRPELPFPPGDPFGEMFRRFFGEPGERVLKRQSLGSGVIVNPDGFIVTNNHVIANASEVIVKLHDDREFTAKIVGTDPKTDLALLKIDATGLPVIPFGDSDRLEVGEPVMAIGNPFGLIETVTTGIVSAKGRVIGTGPYDDFIQTDTSINPGNSGGPLIDTQGTVVGINSAIFSRTGGSVGIGFAIPINLAKIILFDLKERGQVVRGWLGVAIQDVTPEIARTLEMEKAEGALVAEVVPGSPAAAAGLKQGDVIIGFNGRRVKSSQELPRLVAATPPGTKSTVTILRDGRDRTLGVKIGQLQEEQAKAGPTPSVASFGLTVQKVTPEIAEQLGLKVPQGVVVTGVDPNGAAAAADVRSGDVILEVNRASVNSVHEFRAALKRSKKKGTLLLLSRNGVNRYVVIEPGQGTG